MQAWDRQLLRKFLQIQANIHLMLPRHRGARSYTLGHAPSDCKSPEFCANSYKDNDTGDYDSITWSRRLARVRIQSEPEHLVRTEYDSVADGELFVTSQS